MVKVEKKTECWPIRSIRLCSNSVLINGLPVSVCWKTANQEEYGFQLIHDDDDNNKNKKPKKNWAGGNQCHLIFDSKVLLPLWNFSSS